MRIRRHRSKSLIISILLIMVCVQCLSMHFHYADANDEYQPHAHAHTLGSAHADHLTVEHHDEVNADILGTLARRSLSLDLFVSVLLVFVFTYLSKPRHWPTFRKIRPQHQLLFFRPPLRAPPL